MTNSLLTDVMFVVSIESAINNGLDTQGSSRLVRLGLGTSVPRMLPLGQTMQNFNVDYHRVRVRHSCIQRFSQIITVQ